MQAYYKIINIMSIIYSFYTSIRLFIYLKILNKFQSQKKLLISFRKKIFDQKLLSSIQEKNLFPKYFIINNFNHKFNLLRMIDEFPKPKNNFNNKNIKTYQSEHNIHEHKNFIEFSEYLEDFLNKLLIPEYGLKNFKIKINKMWFVISSQNGKIHPHNHLDGHISGVLYPKNSKDDDNGLMIYNPFKKLEKNIYNYLSKVKIEYTNTNYNLERSSSENMIIFDSFLMHSVSKINFKNEKDLRISLAWDAVFESKT